MDVVLSEKAQKDLTRLARSTPKIERNIRAHLHRLPETFARDPELKGIFRGYRKQRVSDYRIIYRTDVTKDILLIIRVGHRRDIYDR